MSADISLPLSQHDVSQRADAPKRLSPARLASAIAIGAWAGLFWFVLVSGRTSLYLGSRTHWVVPLGAVVLTILFVGRLASMRVEGVEPIRARDSWTLAVIALPVVVLMSIPAASLGTFAVSRRASLASGGFASGEAIPQAGDLSLVNVGSALINRDSMRSLVARAGSTSTFTGFVDREPGEPANEFLLSRFLISCCIADALSIQVRVVNAPPGEFKPDDWVRASGKLYPLGREVILDADTVQEVAKPHHPYLNP
jgi:putative membrane protein